MTDAPHESDKYALKSVGAGGIYVCDEGLSSTQPRDGRATKPLATRSIKIDYLFGPSAGTVVSCDVTADEGQSDHYPVKARFRF
ncbi:hypothetical protein ACH4M4_32975 [Streptomyces sp. NPDC017254]|uniref:hypothetical protein n=1 Tax=unclassified Streptomyces TaxID=2593676 RepID=UPI0037A0BEA9